MTSGNKMKAISTQKHMVSPAGKGAVTEDNGKNESSEFANVTHGPSLSQGAAGAGAGPAPRPGFLLRVSHAVSSSIERFFAWLAGHVVSHPGIAIGAVVLLTVAMGSGFTAYDEDLNKENQFAPLDSRAVHERDLVYDMWGHPDRPVQLFFEGDILTPAGISFMLEVHMFFTREAHALEGGFLWNYTALCARPFKDVRNPCRDPVGILAHWGWDPAQIASASAADILHRMNSPWGQVDSSSLPLTYVLGGITRDSSGRIVSAKSARLEYYLKQVPSKISGVGDDDRQSRAFELEVRDVIEDRLIGLGRASAGVEVFMFSQACMNDASAKAANDDVNSLIIGYILMFLYSTTVLSRGRLKYSHATLGLVSVCSVGMATLSSYGMCWYLGVKFNRVVQVLILVLLGVGVDDTFVIMDSWWDNAHIADMKQRMIAAVAHAGPSITITSITDVIAFATGASTVLPALSDFCVYAVIGITLDFAYQCTFFVVVAYLDSVRQKKNRSDCCCCVTVDEETGCCITKRVADAADAASQNPSVRPWKESDRPLLARLVGTYLPRLTVGSTIGKSVVFAISIAFIGTGIYGCTELKMNFDREWFIPDDIENIQGAIRVREGYFGGNALPLGVYTTKLWDYPRQQERVALILRAAEANHFALPGSASSWLRDFAEWAESTSPQNVTSQPGPLVPGTMAAAPMRVVNPVHFYSLLRDFLTPGVGPPTASVHLRSLVWDDYTTKQRIVAGFCRVMIDGSVAGNGVKAVDAMESIRRDMDAVVGGEDGWGFAWVRTFVFWEGFAVMMREMFRNVVVAGAAVFLLVTILTANIILSIFVTSAIACVDVCLLGTMPIVGVEINMVSVVCVVLAVGLAVDYSVHIANVYLQSRAQPTPLHSANSQRAGYALWKIGPSVVNGGLSTFTAILPLVFAKSYVFKVFFRMFFLIIFFGLWFGVFALPCVMSIIGPPPNIDAAALEDEPWHNPLSPDYGRVFPDDE